MIFSKNEAKVPELNTNEITVTEVKMSQDLKIAKAFVLPLGGQDAEKKIEKYYQHLKLNFIIEYSLFKFIKRIFTAE